MHTCRAETAGTYKIGQVDVAVSVEKDVVGLDISVDYVPAVDIPQGATQLCDPEPDRLLSKGISGDVEPQITACHQVDHKVPVAACKL